MPRISLLVVVLALSVLATTRSWAQPFCSSLPCTSADVTVTGANINNVTFTPSGGKWIVVITLCSDVSAVITVASPSGNGDISRLEIKAGNNCYQSWDVGLNFDATSPVRDLDLLVQGAGIATMDICGLIAGHVGDLQASSIDKEGTHFIVGGGLVIEGDLDGDIVLSNDNYPIQVSRLKVEGNFEGGLDANNGAIDI